jgi:hypothetical protein
LVIWVFGQKNKLWQAPNLCLQKLLCWPKYPDIQIFGWPNSIPNPSQIWDPVIFCYKSGKKVAASGQSVLCLNLVLLQFPNI